MCPTGDNDTGSPSPFSGRGGTEPGPARSNYSSYLPDVYVGSPNRVERYGQYNVMDNDSWKSMRLWISLQNFVPSKSRIYTNFNLHFNNKATNSEIKVLQNYLLQWSKLQKFDTKNVPYIT